MALNTITIGAAQYNSIGPGVYSISTSLFGSPANTIKIVPAKVATRNGPTTFQIVRTFEKNFTVGSVVEKRKMTVTLSVSVPAGFTSSEVSYGADTVSSVFTQFGDRILMGES